MNKLAVFALALATLIVAAGCGFSEKNVVGKWVGTLTLSEEDKQAAGALAEMAANMKFEIEFKEDKTYVMNAGGQTEGTWTYADNKVNMVVTKYGGLDISSVPGVKESDKAQSLTVQNGGKELVMASPDDKSTSTITFSRSSLK